MFKHFLFSINIRKTISVYYNQQSKSFSYILDKYDQTATARAIFQDDNKYQGGYRELHVEASGADDDIMARAAGFAEGYITQPLFDDYYQNVRTALCKEFMNCSNVGDVHNFFKSNYDWVIQNVSQSPLDTEYRWGANITLSQFYGLYDGYSHACADNDTTPIADSELWLMQCRSEIYDVYKSLHPERNIDPRLLVERRGSLVVVTGSQYKNLLIGHSSWRSYSEMMPIAKRYRIHYQNKYNVVTRKSFSSYPLLIHSDEGLTITDQGLIIGASSIAMDPTSIVAYADFKGLPHWMREVIADQTSHTAFDWSDTYSQNPSKTSGIEWTVINLKQFVPNKGVLPNLINVIEEIPKTIVYQDLTEFLRNQSSFGSFDIPFDDNIYTQAGYFKRAATDPELYDLHLSSRVQIMNEIAPTVVFRDDMLKLMRFNDLMDPKQIGRLDLGMSPREENTSDTPQLCRGAVDAKFTDVERALHLEWDGVVGPFWKDNSDFYKPFRFDDYESCKEIRHGGVDEEFRYDWFGNYFDIDV